jgi:hypothetical protein
VLLRGNHREIEEWRFKQSVLRTRRKRPELLAGLELDAQRRKWLEELSATDGAEGSDLEPTNSGKTGTAGESS